jgi:hypothetical protein
MNYVDERESKVQWQRNYCNDRAGTEKNGDWLSEEANCFNIPIFMSTHTFTHTSICEGNGFRYVTSTSFVPKVSVLIFLCTTWERTTSLMYIGELVMILAACTYLFKLDRLSLSWTIAVCVRSCFITSVTFAIQPWYCSQRILTSRTDS